MNESTTYNIIFMAIGLFTIISSITNWNYFFNHRKAQFIINLIGRKGARIFYIIFGLGFFSMGFLSMIGYITLNN